MKTLVGVVDEKSLVAAAQADPNCFAELYRANFGRVYAFIFCRVKDRALAEDLTGEVFRQALSKIQGFEWRGAPFSSWLLRIAANLLSDHWRDPTARLEVPIEEDCGSGNEPGFERAALLAQLLDSLPDDQKLVVTRRFLDDRSIREIAAEMGRSEGAIKQLQFRALQNMKQKVRSNHG